VAIAYSQDQTFSVADKMFPVVGVNKQSDSYFTFEKSDFRRVEAKLRAPGAPAAEGGYNISTGSYFCKQYAFRVPVTEEARANADEPLNLDMNAARLVAEQLMLKRDSLWAAAYFTTSVWARDLVGATDFVQWGGSGGDPIKLIHDEAVRMQRETGKRPNRMLVGAEVMPALLNHPDIIERIKYTQRGIASEELLAQLFGVKSFVVGGLSIDSAAEGATDSNAFLFGKSALLCYSPDSPSIIEPSAGYLFSWNVAGSGPGGLGVRKWRSDERKCDFVEGEMAFDPKVTATDLGTFLSAVIA
jgi:hypothetical protein